MTVLLQWLVTFRSGEGVAPEPRSNESWAKGSEFGPDVPSQWQSWSEESRRSRGTSESWANGSQGLSARASGHDSPVRLRHT